MDGEALATRPTGGLALLQIWTESEVAAPSRLRRRGLRARLLAQCGRPLDAWGCVALCFFFFLFFWFLHDFDYERHPTLYNHRRNGSPHLRGLGYPEWFVLAVSLAREPPSDGRRSRERPRVSGSAPATSLSGFVHACGLVRRTA